MRAHQAIAKGYEAFQEAYHRGDSDAISRMYTEDAELLVPETPTIRGREAIAQAWKHILGSGGNNVRVDIGEVQETADWAYEVGRFTASAPHGSLLNAGKYIVIWKRHSTGEWKIHRDIFNADIPIAQT
jgi:ketosteroid isomerase-like protein